MNKRLYNRAMLGQYWYNSTELLAWAVLKRKRDGILFYEGKVPYGESEKEYVNICSRKDLRDVKKPVFVYIHGGGWISGLPEMRDTYIAEWAKKGFFTVSVSYTWAPQKEYPWQLIEMFKAIDFIYDNAEKYNLDMSNVVFSGESAGGYYIMYAAAVAADKSLLDRLGIEFRHRDEFSIRALVSNCGCYDFCSLTDETKKQSKFPDMKMMVTSFLGKNMKETREWLKTEEGQLSYPHVNEKFPPMFVIWADNDYLRYEAFDLMQQLSEYGVQYDDFEATGIISMHGWAIATIVEKGRECLRRSFDFVLPLIPDYFELQGKEWRIIC